MDRVGIDVIGPLPISKKNNKYILVIGDHFTQWMEAYALPDQQSETIAQKLVLEFISRFGTPLEIHSDQRKNFESSLFAKICKLFEIKKTRTTSYRPCSNGIIEKFNGTLGKMIRSFVDKNATNWDLYIGILMAAYRSTPHPATGYSPNMLMLGREVVMPNQLLFPLPSSHTYLDPDFYVASIKDKLEEIYHTVRKNLNMSAVTQKKNYDTRISQTQFSRGTLVYKFNNVSSKSLRRGGLAHMLSLMF